MPEHDYPGMIAAAAGVNNIDAIRQTVLNRKGSQNQVGPAQAQPIPTTLSGA